MTPLLTFAILTGVNQKSGVKIMTESPKGVPLRSQGEALPPDFPCAGQWVHKPRMFLYHPNAQQTLGGPEMTLVVGDSFGLNAMNLAFELGVSIQEIFEHNRTRTLYLVTAEDVPPTMGAAFAKRYVFQIGDRQTSITTEWGGPSGNA